MWVVFFHASEGRHIDRLKDAIPDWSHGLFDLGDNGVAIFFVLSGYVIAHSLQNLRFTPSFLGRFALRRSIRLDPPLWLSIAFVIAFGALSASVKDENWLFPSTGQIITNATYTQLFFGLDSINSVYWTLCYEVQFYLALCLWLMLAERHKTFAFASMFLTAAAFGTGVIESPVRGLFVDLWHCFFLGSLAYWAHRNRAAEISFATLVLILSISVPTTFTFCCMITAIGLFVARKTGYIKHGLSREPLVLLGTISYSLYLTHNPVTGAAFFLFSGLPQLVALLLTIVVCVAVAFGFWLVIERPSIRLAHRIKLRRRTYPASAQEDGRI